MVCKEAMCASGARASSCSPLGFTVCVWQFSMGSVRGKLGYHGLGRGLNRSMEGQWRCVFLKAVEHARHRK